MKLELDDSYFTLEVTQHASGDFLSGLESKQRALDIRDYLGKHPDTPQRYVYLGETQIALGNSLSALQFDQRALTVFTIKMKDFSLHFNVSLQKLD